MNIHLIHCFKTQPEWKFGEAIFSHFSIENLNENIRRIITDHQNDYILICNQPELITSNEHLENPDFHYDAYHYSLSLQTYPENLAVHFYRPLWMLAIDLDKNQAGVSWKLSPHFCLIHARVFSLLGFFPSGYSNLTWSMLDFGYLMVVRGLIPIYLPPPGSCDAIPQHLIPHSKDQIQFARNHFSSKWYFLYLFMRNFAKKNNHVYRCPPNTKDPSSKIPFPPSRTEGQDYSILIPSLNRPGQITTLLSQIRNLPTLPRQVIVIDQSTPPLNQKNLQSILEPIPLTYEHLTEAGQCTSRNLGLKYWNTDYLLFLDDDVELTNDIFTHHFENLLQNKSHVSIGIALEPHSPKNLHVVKRVSEVFNTCNSIIGRESKFKTIFFRDFFNRRSRADLDFGTQLYLSGNILFYNSEISLIHNHSPSGGLRTFNQRVRTYAQSRKSMGHFHTLNSSEIFYALMYFPRSNLKQAIFNNLLNSLMLQGPLWKKILKIFWAILYLPVLLKKMNFEIQIVENYLLTQCRE